MNKINRNCPNCGIGGNIDRNLKCHTCGSQLELDEFSGEYFIKLMDCPECSQPNSSCATYCSGCRKKLKGEGEKKNYSKLLSLAAAIIVIIGSMWLYTTAFSKDIPKEKYHINTIIPSACELIYDGTSKLSIVQIEKKPVISNKKGPKMDVVFCVDTTGSMGDEIAVIKSQLLKMVEEIQQGNPAPVVRFGVVAYRDRGDEYITKKFVLIDDITKTQKIINSLNADGGGDYEESVNEALHVAVQGMNWDKKDNVKKIVFLIGDASPHTDYQQDYNYKKEVEFASQSGIMVNTLSCSGMQKEGNKIFQYVADATNGDFEYLTYKYAYVGEDGKKHVLLNQGGKNYSVDDKYAESEEWRDGASYMASSDKAKECTSSPDIFSAPSSYTCAETSVSSVCKDEKAPSVSGGTCSSPEAVNNLDSIMIGKLKREAKKEGVTY